MYLDSPLRWLFEKAVAAGKQTPFIYEIVPGAKIAAEDITLFLKTRDNKFMQPRGYFR